MVYTRHTQVSGTILQNLDHAQDGGMWQINEYSRIPKYIIIMYKMSLHKEMVVDEVLVVDEAMVT